MSVAQTLAGLVCGLALWAGLILLLVAAFARLRRPAQSPGPTVIELTDAIRAAQIANQRYTGRSLGPPVILFWDTSLPRAFTEKAHLRWIEKRGAQVGVTVVYSDLTQ